MIGWVSLDKKATLNVESAVITGVQSTYFNVTYGLPKLQIIETDTIDQFKQNMALSGLKCKYS